VSEPEADLDIQVTQVTPAHVVELIRDQVIPRLDRLERTVKDSGLNGHTPYLKAFLEQYAANSTSRQAWDTVRQDISYRFRFLSSPRAWIKALFYASIGGLGWKLVSGASLPHHWPF
jgi:hypothetical protein